MQSKSLSRSSGSAIFVSDEDLEDTAHKPFVVAKTRVKRRRKSPHHQSSLAWICQWWPFLLILAVLCLLFSEMLSVRGSGKHNESTRRHGFHDKQAREVETTSLDRMDMPTRSVGGGIREPCLKLLSAEEIETLDFPPSSSSVVQTLYFKKVSMDTRNWNLSDLSENDHRFTLFTGNQTVEERRQSFKVREVMEVHCGFASRMGGFNIQSTDKSYMDQCTTVVVTCNFGGGDNIYQPINMTQASLSRVCYVALWDDVTLNTQALEGRKPDENGKIGHWRIVVVKNLPFINQRLNGKIPKMLNHRLFPNAKYSIWVDSKYQFRRDPIGVLEALLWRTNSVLAISEHGARDCVYSEGDAIVRKNKASPEEVAAQLNQYRAEGFPKKARFNGHKALAEASVIIREHTPASNLFMCLWFNEVTRFTARDQLSFPYVSRKLSMLNINMLPVCTRKALVNSLGHVRKPKPLSPPILSS